MAKLLNPSTPSPFLLATTEAAAAVPENWGVVRVDLRRSMIVSASDPAGIGDRVVQVVLDVDDIQAALAEARAHGYTPSWWPEVIETPPTAWHNGDLVAVVDIYDTTNTKFVYYGQVITGAANDSVIIGTWSVDLDGSGHARAVAANAKLAEVTGDNPPLYDSCLTISGPILVPWETVDVPPGPTSLDDLRDAGRITQT